MCQPQFSPVLYSEPALRLLVSVPVRGACPWGKEGPLRVEVGQHVTCIDIAVIRYIGEFAWCFTW